MTVPAGGASEPLVTSSRSVVRSIIAIGLTAIVLWVAASVAMGGVVAVLFGQWVGLLAFGVVLVAACAVIVAVLFACTGRPRIGAAITVTAAAVVANGIALVGFGTIPMIWVQPGFELVHLAIAVPSALILGLFLGPWWLRILGFAGILALVVGGIWVAWPAAEPAGPSQSEQQADANFEYFIASGVYPMVADVPGGTIVGVVPDGGPFRTLVLTAEGGVLEVVLDQHPIASNPEITPCWYLADATMRLEETDTLEDYENWCVKDEDVWRLVDGTGYARMQEGSLVAVRSAIEQNLELARGDRPANAAEVLEAWGSLRPMTEAEVREHMQRR